MMWRRFPSLRLQTPQSPAILFVAFVMAGLLTKQGLEHAVGGPLSFRPQDAAEALLLWKTLETHLYFAAAIAISLLSWLIATLLQTIVGPPSSSPLAAFPHTAAPIFSPSHPLRFFFVFVFMPLFLYGHFFASSALSSLDPMDEGLKVAAFNQARHQNVPYRDIYFQYGPGTEIIQPAVARTLWGDSMGAQRRLQDLIQPLGYVALYVLIAVLLRGRWMVLLIACFLFSRKDLWMSHRPFFPLMACCLMVMGMRSDERRRFFLFMAAGFVSFAGFLYSMENGVLWGAALLLYGCLRAFYIRRHPLMFRLLRKDAAAYVMGVATLFLPLLFYLTVTGGLLDFMANTFLVGHTLLGLWGLPTPAFLASWDAFAANPLFLFSETGVFLRWYVPPLLFIAVIAWSVSTGDSTHRRTAHNISLLLACAGFFFFIVALGRSDYEHWHKGNFFFWPLLVWCLANLSSFFKAHAGFFNRITILLCGCGLLTYFYALSYPLSFVMNGLHPLRSGAFLKQEPRDRSLAGRLNGLPPGDSSVQRAVKITSLIQEHVPPGDFFYAFTDDSIYYYTADVVNPTKYANISYVGGERMVSDVLSSLRRHPPKAILVDKKDGRLVARSANDPIRRFIEQNYQPLAPLGNKSLYLPRQREAVS